MTLNVLMSVNMRIGVKRHHTHNSTFLLECVITLQIKSSLGSISNDPIDLALTLKEKITQTTH